jgi:1-acyl-sn-glycerol-3-phosphate acyltransferase
VRLLQLSETPHRWFLNVVGVFRLLLVGVLLGVCLLHVAIAYGSADIKGRHRIVRGWANRLLWILNVSVDYRTSGDSPPPSQGLFVCNHISFLDIFVIDSVLPSPFVAKSNIASWPLIGWLVAHTGTEFIRRGSKTAAHQTHQRIAARLAAGERFAIFPEGTTSSGAQVLPFHAALFQSAIESNSVVHCLALSYHDDNGVRSDAPAFLGEMTLLRCMFQIASAGGLTARLSLLPAEDYHAVDRRRMAHRAQHRIATAIAAINQT